MFVGQTRGLDLGLGLGLGECLIATQGMKGRKVDGHVHGQRYLMCVICRMGCWVKVYNILCWEGTELW